MGGHDSRQWSEKVTGGCSLAPSFHRGVSQVQSSSRHGAGRRPSQVGLRAVWPVSACRALSGQIGEQLRHIAPHSLLSSRQRTIAARCAVVRGRWAPLSADPTVSQYDACVVLCELINARNKAFIKGCVNNLYK